jgi:hypothetical protein
MMKNIEDVKSKDRKALTPLIIGHLRRMLVHNQSLIRFRLKVILQGHQSYESCVK